RKALNLLESTNQEHRNRIPDNAPSWLSPIIAKKSSAGIPEEEMDAARVEAERDTLEVHIARTQADLGLAYRVLGDYDSAVGNLQSACKTFELANLHEPLAAALVELSIAFLLSGWVKEAKDSLSRLESFLKNYPGLSSSSTELFIHTIKAFVYWQLDLGKIALENFRLAEHSLAKAQSSVLEALYLTLRGLFTLAEEGSLADELRHSGRTDELLTAAITRWKMLEIDAPIVDINWALMTWVADSHLKGATESLPDPAIALRSLHSLEEYWGKSKVNSIVESKRSLVLIQYGRLLIELVEKKDKPEDLLHFLRMFNRLLKITRRQQILDVRIAIYGQIFSLIIKIGAYKDKQERDSLWALLDDFSRDLDEIK
ncbi:MAG TPA: hypothetical protein VJ044_12275, partial [Candidatus Hodarchaeales archaeon]|nr:hypothetical protein [Candidatus Hodarchaeales archaeon]